MSTGFSVRLAKKTGSIIAHSILVGAFAACEFESDIEPLVLPDAPEQPFQSEFGEPQPEIGLEPSSSGGGVLGFAGFDSSQAISICGEQLASGDSDMGMCDVPGSDSFYIWTDPDQVIEVGADNPYLLQFQQSVTNRLDAKETYENAIVDLGLEGTAFFIEVVLLFPACATIFLCLADGAALVLTGAAIGNTADSGSNGYLDFLNQTENAGFYSCLIQGGLEQNCRDMFYTGGTP